MTMTTRKNLRGRCRRRLLTATFAALLFGAARDLLAAPAAVTDIIVQSSGFRNVSLRWSAPYDTSASTPAVFYEIRVSSYRVIVNDADWNDNSTSSLHPYRIKFATVTVAGFREMFVVSSLVNDKTFFFAIKSSTDNINWSGVDTASPEPQSAPYNSVPGNVSGYNYTGTPTTVVFVSTPYLSWNAVTNSGNLGTDNLYGDSIVSYSLWYSTMPGFEVKSVVDGITQTNYIPPALTENTTYYWRVYAKDAEGLFSQSVVGTPQFVVNASSEHPAAFSLIQPINDFIETGTKQPALWWNYTTDPDPADHLVYDLYISTSRGFETAVTTKSAGITVNFWAPSWELAENGRYYWKVHARDTSGLETAASTQSFRINTAAEDPGAFDNYYPVSGAMIFTSSPTLSWTPSTDPDPGDSVTYDIKYSSYDPALSDFPQVLAVAATFYKINGLVEDAVYWWRAIAKDSTSRTRQSATISSFTVNEINSPPAAFSLIFSSGISRLALPPLVWQPAVDPEGYAVTYTVYLSSSANFASFISSAGLVSPAYAPTALQENATFWWYVAASDQLGLKSFSATWYFVVDALSENPLPFNLVSPVGGNDVQTLFPKLEWQSASDPDPYDYVAYYVVEFATSSDFSASTVAGPLGATYYSFVSPASNYTTYYWKVYAQSALTGSATAAASSFVVRNLAPADFYLSYPSGIISTASPQFSWLPAADPEGENVSYDFYLSSAAPFSVWISSLGISATYYAAPLLEENKRYWWYVAARDQSGNVRASTVAAFAINAAEENPYNFSIIAPPASSSISTQIPLFEWQASGDADPDDYVVYVLWYSPDAAFASKTEITGLSSTQYQVPSSSPLSPDTTYYWRVFARDVTGRQSYADGSFFVAPSARPLSPAAFDAVYSAADKKVVLSWAAPTQNADGTAVGALSHYLVYKSYGYEELFTAQPSTSVPAAVLSCELDNVLTGAYFAVRAVNTLGVKGEFSKSVRVGEEISVIWRDSAGGVIVESVKNVLPSTVSVAISADDLPSDDPKTSYAFRVVVAAADGTEILRFADPVIFRVKSSASSSSPSRPSPSIGKNACAAISPVTAEAIYWFNGVEWVSLGGRLEDGFLVAKAAAPGRFRLRAVSRSSDFRIMNVWPKVITPNADGINDEFNITFENPRSDKIEGAVYDSTGYKIAALTEKTDSWATWNGKDAAGAVVPSGIYLYQLKVGGSVKNGTLAVAR